MCVSVCVSAYRVVALRPESEHPTLTHPGVFISSSAPDNESDPEASEFDLGTKIKTPKDVMLEELSLLNNKGSKMFRMRQQRVERFIVSDESMVSKSCMFNTLFRCMYCV